MIMGRMPLLAYLWPGLPMILASGNWLGLVWAVGFAALTNLLIFASLWWPELLTVHVRNGVWLAAAVYWGVASIAAWRNVQELEPDEASPAGVTFADANNHYLRADWFGAERILLELMGRNPRDVDSGLLLATLWRHTGRIAEASQQLDRLELLDGARKWALEIHQERRRLEEVASAGEPVLDVGRAA